MPTTTITIDRRVWEELLNAQKTSSTVTIDRRLWEELVRTGIAPGDIVFEDEDDFAQLPPTDDPSPFESTESLPAYLTVLDDDALQAATVESSTHASSSLHWRHTGRGVQSLFRFASYDPLFTMVVKSRGDGGSKPTVQEFRRGGKRGPLICTYPSKPSRIITFPDGRTLQKLDLVHGRSGLKSGMSFKARGRDYKIIIHYKQKDGATKADKMEIFPQGVSHRKNTPLATFVGDRVTGPHGLILLGPPEADHPFFTEDGQATELLESTILAELITRDVEEESEIYGVYRAGLPAPMR